MQCVWNELGEHEMRVLRVCVSFFTFAPTTLVVRFDYCTHFHRFTQIAGKSDHNLSHSVLTN